MSCLNVWRQLMSEKTDPTILWTGAKPWEGSPTMNYSEHCPNGTWIGTDIEDGDGVSIVSDLENIDEATKDKFDGIFCPATLEHVKRPWVAMQSMFNCLKEGGLLFLDTHQAFPLHGYPHDYFRFSTEALKSMAIDSGFRVLLSEYQFPCSIVPPPEVTRWNTAAESYLNVNLCASREPNS
jgi:SAM-dependent methyltransferase